MKLLGTQILLELEKCDPDTLDNLDKIKQCLTNAASKAGANIIGETFHKFSPVGVTGVVSIAESHISIHTWPEYEYASVDIFSCGEQFNIKIASQIIINGLMAQKPYLLTIERGLDNPKFKLQ